MSRFDGFFAKWPQFRVSSCNLISPLCSNYLSVEEDSVPTKDVQIKGTDSIPHNTALKYNSNPRIQHERNKTIKYFFLVATNKLQSKKMGEIYFNFSFLTNWWKRLGIPDLLKKVDLPSPSSDCSLILRNKFWVVFLYSFKFR